jgi:hypothetical protein
LLRGIPMSRHVEPKPDVKRKFRCIFCESEFTADELLFCIEDPNSDEDQIFRQFTDNFKQYDAKIPKHRFFKKDEWLKENQIWEKDGDKDLLPLQVDVRITSSGLGGNESSGPSMDIVGERPTPPKSEGNTNNLGPGMRDKTTLLERLCPYCHCVLPKGFATCRFIQIGMLGGRRSGKTTYIIMACMNLAHRLDSVDGLNLANVTVLTESKEYLGNLYEKYKVRTDATAADAAIIDKPVFPIILRIESNDHQYKPFFISFRDIPGELMQDRPDAEQKLLASPIINSDAIFAIVDANMIQLTKEHANEMRLRNQEGENKQLDFCFEQFSDVYGHLQNFLKHRMKNLKSLQVIITKLDEYMQMEKTDMEERRMKVLDDCIYEHRDAINDDCLDEIDRQLCAFFNGDAKENISRPDIKKMETALQTSLTSNENIHMACSALSSRMHERACANYLNTLNILDPVFRLCSWENLLPHQSMMANDTDVATTEPELKPVNTFWDKVRRFFGH